MKRLQLLDLFSGIGGFSLGLERTGGFETVAFCEIEEYPRRVLKKHWPEVPCYDDIRDLAASRLRADGIIVDAISAGFPCQDISLAGAGAGLRGERSGLWIEVDRLIGELEPRVVFLENVSELLARGIDTVLGSLASLGYDAEWHCIPASYVGARTLRDRAWIVAHSKCDSIQGGANIAAAWEGKSRAQQLAGLVQPCAWPTLSDSRNCGTGHGIPNGSHRNRAIGNAVVPQIPELLGRAYLQSIGRAA